MEYREKESLINKIKQLDSDTIHEFYNLFIVPKHSENENKENSTHYELDLNKFNDKELRDIERFIKETGKDKKEKVKKKATTKKKESNIEEIIEKTKKELEIKKKLVEDSEFEDDSSES